MSEDTNGIKGKNPQEIIKIRKRTGGERGSRI